jgi:hypothetical protein
MRHKAALLVSAPAFRMKNLPIGLVCTLMLLAPVWLIEDQVEASSFVNLDFELANTNNLTLTPGIPYPSGTGFVKDLLPAWSLLAGSNQLTNLGFNSLALDGDSVSLISKDALGDFSPFPNYAWVFPNGFQGKYAFGISVGSAPFFLSQQGDIPVDVRVLTINANHNSSLAHLEVTLGDVVLTTNAISGYQTFDISEFAGQTAELEMKLWMTSSALAPNTVGDLHIGIDTIAFSAPPILSFARSSDQLILSWPSSMASFVLDTSDSLPAAAWKPVTNRPVVTDGRQTVTVPMNRRMGFYRLRLAP